MVKPMNLGDILRSWRYHHELTLREAARRIGVSVSVLDRLERGANLVEPTRSRLLRWLFSVPDMEFTK